MTQDLAPSVAIIVLTWNQRDLTMDCVNSLVTMDYPAERLQIIVVDNGSQDNTVVDIRNCFPQVVVLENGENLGFAEGNNAGLRFALQGQAQYVMLLNNDTIVETAMLSKLIAYAAQHSDVGIVTPIIYYHAEPQRIWCAGAAIDWRSGRTSRLRAEETDCHGSQEPEKVDFASGCAMCLKRQVIENVGMLDPRFFIYYEESDWCVRATRAGWHIIFLPSVSVWHRISSAMGVSSPATDYYMHRNALLFFARHGQGKDRIILLLRLLIRQILTILAYTIKSRAGQRLPNRDARLLALRDAFLGRWGKMGADVAHLCYPKRYERTVPHVERTASSNER
jgi:GT2 family glycosyltransferase